MNKLTWSYVEAARVPDRLKPQAFGRWRIRRASIKDRPNASPYAQLRFLETVGFRSQTILLRQQKRAYDWDDEIRANKDGGCSVVMEDSLHELKKHLPIWLQARGRVLVTGLGLGCVVRGLLANAAVEQITVVEIDRDILRIVGHEFVGNQRVRLVRGDAFMVELREKFDFAWHDIHEMDGSTHLSLLHAQLLGKFQGQCARQGAWNMPRWIKRSMPAWMMQ